MLTSCDALLIDYYPGIDKIKYLTLFAPHHDRNHHLHHNHLKIALHCLDLDRSFHHIFSHKSYAKNVNTTMFGGYDILFTCTGITNLLHCLRESTIFCTIENLEVNSKHELET